MPWDDFLQQPPQEAGQGLEQSRAAAQVGQVHSAGLLTFPHSSSITGSP